MTKTPYEQVWEFHKAFEQPRYTYPSLPDKARRELRQELLREEYEEYKVGEEANDLVAIADALADMTYIIYGTGIEYGLPMDELFAEVHRSNMSKLDPVTGKPVYREDGKVMKPATYSRADLATIIREHQEDYTYEFAPETPRGAHDGADSQRL
jgi:predicted HAD superfamily Cof-like phosphohydrolase